MRSDADLSAGETTYSAGSSPLVVNPELALFAAGAYLFALETSECRAEGLPTLCDINAAATAG